MKRNSNFFVNSTHKTKTWWTFVSVSVLVFVPFLIVWLLVCEINLLGVNWLVAKNSSVWHGVVTIDNIDTLANKYGMFFLGGKEPLKTALNSYINSDKQASILACKTFFNPIVLVVLFGVLLIAVGYPILFNATRVSGLDVEPFATSIGMILFSLIISGLIPHWGRDKEALYWIVRILLSFVFGIVIFIITNKCVNKFLASRDYAVDIYFGYKANDAATKLQREQLRQNIDVFKQNSDDDKEYVEIEQEVK